MGSSSRNTKDREHARKVYLKAIVTAEKTYLQAKKAYFEARITAYKVFAEACDKAISKEDMDEV